MSELALTMVLVSAVLHASWNTLTKSAANPVAFLLLMEILSVLVLLPALALTDLGALPAELWAAMLITSVVHALYSYFLVRAYESGDLTLVYPISRSTPAFVAPLAGPLLGEHVPGLGVAGIALVVVSLWLIQFGTADARNPGGSLWHRVVAPGTGYAYLTLLATVGYSLLDANIMRGLDALAWHSVAPRALVFFVIATGVQTPIFAVMARRRYTAAELGSLLKHRAGTVCFVTLGSIASYGLILEALRFSEVSYVVAVRQTSVLLAVILAAWTLRERPSPMRLAGIVGTVLGVVAIAFA